MILWSRTSIPQIHFPPSRIKADLLLSALYLKNDPYENSDAVFGVKDSLIVELEEVTDGKMAEQFGVKLGTKLIKYDFVLVTNEAAMELRLAEAKKSMKAQGIDAVFLDGLPVPALD